MKHFFYRIPQNDGKYSLGSVNPDYIMRTVETYPGQLILLIDDIHEELQEVPIESKGKVTKQLRKVDTCSEIRLLPEDSVRFKKLFSIDEDGLEFYSPEPEKELETV